MLTLRRAVMALTTVAVLFVIGSTMKSSPATVRTAATLTDKDKPTDVAIVNPLPLPVSVTLGAGQALPVTLGGPLITRDIATTAGHPFRLQAFGQFDANEPPFQVAFVTNTTGRRMVVEHAAFSAQIRNPATVTGAVLQIGGFVANVFNVLPVPDPGGFPNFGNFGGSAPVKIYLEPNALAQVTITTGGALANPDGSIILTLFGFLVDP